MLNNLYFDRSVTNQSQSFFSQAVAPHTNTARWTYTVPTGVTPYGRQAIIEHYEMALRRDTVATTMTQPDSVLLSSSGFPLARIISDANVIGDYGHLASQCQVRAAAGDVITSASVISDTGGTVSIVLYAAIKEFS